MATSRAGDPSETENVMDTVHRACYSTGPLFNKPWHSGGRVPEGIFLPSLPSQGSSFSEGLRVKKGTMEARSTTKVGTK